MQATTRRVERSIPVRVRHLAFPFLAAVLGVPFLEAAPALAQPVDSLAHPIMTSCGVRLDPVGYLFERGPDLGLSSTELDAIAAVGDRLGEANRPHGERWWGLVTAAETSAAQRREVLDALRRNYRAALGEIEVILGPERWSAALTPPARGDPRVRCLCRSVLAIIEG